MAAEPIAAHYQHQQRMLCAQVFTNRLCDSTCLWVCLPPTHPTTKKLVDMHPSVCMYLYTGVLVGLPLCWGYVLVVVSHLSLPLASTPYTSQHCLLLCVWCVWRAGFCLRDCLGLLDQSVALRTAKLSRGPCVTYWVALCVVDSWWVLERSCVGNKHWTFWLARRNVKQESAARKADGSERMEVSADDERRQEGDEGKDAGCKETAHMNARHEHASVTSSLCPQASAH